MAAAISTVAYQALGLKHGYWAPISAIIVLQSNLGRSIRASTDRLIGTAIGAAIAATVWWALGRNALALALAVFITFCLCILLRLENSLRLAGVTNAIVLLVSDGTPWQTGVNRFLDVALGILVALAVTVAWPARAAKDLRQSLANTYAGLKTFFQMVVDCSFGEGSPEQELESQKSISLARSQRNAELVADAQLEPGSSDILLTSLAGSAERIRAHIVGMDYAGRAMGSEGVQFCLELPLRDLFREARDAFDFISTKLRGETTTPRNVFGALERMEDEFARLRESGVLRSYSAEELLRFCAFLFRVRQLLTELSRSIELAVALDNSVTGDAVEKPVDVARTRKATTRQQQI